MNTRALRCLFMPPFHHDWKLVENIAQERQSSDADEHWADPTSREFHARLLRCARCGTEAWWNESHHRRPIWH